MKQHLSSPPSSLVARYDVVVVGSGYGGGVAASRLARAGQSVCVLERGREIRPGDYPDDLASAQRQTQIDTAAGQLGDPQALFDVRVNRDMHVVVGCGLGGTSLINANVSLEVRKDLFRKQAWPRAFRDDPDLLDPYYAHAREMLGATPYPDDFPQLNKVTALEHAAQMMGKGERFSRPPINVTFTPGPNHAGIHQEACVLCGDCTSGCNYGAKNTTLMNYLPDAVHHGAAVVCGVEVRSVARRDGVWSVAVRAAGPDQTLPAETVEADVVVLAAGTLGTVGILLRSRAAGLSLSGQLGRRFSGNGDVLAFGYNGYWDKDAEVTPATDLIEAWQAVQREMSASDATLRPTPVHGIGVGRNAVPAEKRPGPCIAGIIDLRDEDAPLDKRLVVEEGVIPGALAAAVAPAFFFRNATEGDVMTYGPAEAAARLKDARALGDMLLAGSGDFTGAAYSGPASRTQTYLVMSHDDAGGELRLDDNERVRVHWPDAGKGAAIVNDADVLQTVCEAVDSQYLPNPLWTDALGRQLVTVHPVGGCAMADDAEHGVVNDRGQVFDARSGAGVHAGLYVCDGSVMPASLGVNPLLTITAFAERCCALLSEERGWSTGYAANPPAHGGDMARAQTPPPVVEREPADVERLRERLTAKLDGLDADTPDPGLALELRALLAELESALEHGVRGALESLLRDLIARFPRVLTPTLMFRETMSGHFSRDFQPSPAAARERISNSYEVASAEAASAGQVMVGKFTIESDALQAMVDDPAHEARLTGEVVCPALDAAPLAIEDGRFNLFSIDPEHVSTWLMRYRGWLVGSNGRRWFLDARKILHQRDDSNWWSDTTTLYVDVLDGDGPGAVRLGMGIIRLDLDELVRQASTIEMKPGSALLALLAEWFPAFYGAVRVIVLGHFAGFFGKTLLQAYGGLIADLADFPGLVNADAARTRRALNGPDKEHYPPYRVGGRFALTRYNGGGRGPVVLAPGFSVTAASFATTTVDRNLVEYLCADGYDVWLFDYRASPDSWYANEPFTIDDIAREDWFGAVRFVRETTQAHDVQVVAHCVGAMSLMMALAAGLEGVRSAVLSQLTLHPVTGWLNYVKTDVGLVSILERKGFRTLNIAGGDSEDEKAIDAVLWSVPVPPGEACKNPVCHRIFSVFGPSYAHAQLNEATHNALVEMFGQIASKPFEQLARIVEAGHAVDADGRNVYLPEVARLALPIDFLAGGRNAIFYPETSRRTYDWLCAHNGPDDYTRTVFPEYAHMDFFIGRNAHLDVFPYIRNCLERHN